MAKWMQGLNEGGRHWVLIPGMTRSFNAGSADRAAVIVRSVNTAPGMLAALHDIANATTDTHAREVARAAIRAATDGVPGAGKGDETRNEGGAHGA